MNQRNRTTLIWLAGAVGGTAFLFILYVLMRLTSGDPIRLRALGVCYCIFGAPFTVAAFCEFVLYEVFKDNEAHSIVTGLIAVWGGFVVRMLFRGLIWVGCFAISTAISAFIVHYLRLKKKAENK